MAQVPQLLTTTLPSQGPRAAPCDQSGVPALSSCSNFGASAWTSVWGGSRAGPFVPRSIPVAQRSPCPGTPAAREPELGPRLGDGAARHTLGPAGETGKVGPGLGLGATPLRPAAGSRRATGPTRAEQAREEAGPLVSASECRRGAGLSAHVLPCVPARARPPGGGGPGHRCPGRGRGQLCPCPGEPQGSSCPPALLVPWAGPPTPAACDCAWMPPAPPFTFSLASLQLPALPTTFLFSVLRASALLLRAPPRPSGQVPLLLGGVGGPACRQLPAGPQPWPDRVHSRCSRGGAGQVDAGGGGRGAAAAPVDTIGLGPALAFEWLRPVTPPQLISHCPLLLPGSLASGSSKRPGGPLEEGGSSPGVGSAWQY